MTVARTYEIIMQTPMGRQNATLMLSENGGSLSGELTTRLGSSPFEGGTIDGQAFAWIAKVDSPLGPLEIACTATVDGDVISGEAKVANLGSSTFSGQRV